MRQFKEVLRLKWGCGLSDRQIAKRCAIAGNRTGSFDTGVLQAEIGPADTVRLVTNDFMFTDGDGYTILSQGTNVQQPGDGLLEISIDYVAATSPVDPVVEGRIVGP